MRGEANMDALIDLCEGVADPPDNEAKPISNVITDDIESEIPVLPLPPPVMPKAKAALPPPGGHLGFSTDAGPIAPVPVIAVPPIVDMDVDVLPFGDDGTGPIIDDGPPPAVAVPLLKGAKKAKVMLEWPHEDHMKEILGRPVTRLQGSSHHKPRLQVFCKSKTCPPGCNKRRSVEVLADQLGFYAPEYALALWLSQSHRKDHKSWVPKNHEVLEYAASGEFVPG